MTVAQYVTPRGTVIQSKGITPDLPLGCVSDYSHVKTTSTSCFLVALSVRTVSPYDIAHVRCVLTHSTMNPYIALLTGPALNKVDLEKIDYKQVRVWPAWTTCLPRTSRRANRLRGRRSPC